MVKKAESTKMVRIKTKIIDKVAKNKARTGIPVGKFFEMAAEEKLKKESK